jgi:hypothetical protein
MTAIRDHLICIDKDRLNKYKLWGQENNSSTMKYMEIIVSPCENNACRPLEEVKLALGNKSLFVVLNN